MTPSCERTNATESPAAPALRMRSPMIRYLRRAGAGIPSESVPDGVLSGSASKRSRMPACDRPCKAKQSSMETMTICKVEGRT